MSNILSLISEIATTKGAKFASFEYMNKSGEVSTYNVCLGASYENALKHNEKALDSATFTDEMKEEARKKLLESLRNNMNPKTASNQSKAQNDAYTSLGGGFKIHNETKQIYLKAYVIKKTQTEEQKAITAKNIASGEFKPVKKPAKNPRPLTVAKNAVKKELELKAENMVSFIFTEEQLKGAKLNGETFTI